MGRRTMERTTGRNGGNVYTCHGSEFGGCPHGHFMSLKGATPKEPEAFLKEIFRLGHEGEELTKQQLELCGFSLDYASADYREQKRVSLTRGMGEKGFLILPSSLDCIGTWGDDLRDPDLAPLLLHLGRRRAIVEVKRFGREPLEEFADYGLHTPGKFELYRHQVSAQVHGARIDEEIADDGIGLLIVAQRRWSAKEQATMRSDDIAYGPFVAHYYAEPPYSAKYCLDRCESFVDAFLADRCPECVSEYPCRWPAPELPEGSVCDSAARFYLDQYDQLNYWSLRAKNAGVNLANAMRSAGVSVCGVDGSSIKVNAAGKLTVTREV